MALGACKRVALKIISLECCEGRQHPTFRVFASVLRVRVLALGQTDLHP